MSHRERETRLFVRRDSDSTFVLVHNDVDGGNLSFFTKRNYTRRWQRIEIGEEQIPRIILTSFKMVFAEKKKKETREQRRVPRIKEKVDSVFAGLINPWKVGGRREKFDKWQQCQRHPSTQINRLTSERIQTYSI